MSPWLSVCGRRVQHFEVFEVPKVDIATMTSFGEAVFTEEIGQNKMQNAGLKSTKILYVCWGLCKITCVKNLWFFIAGRCLEATCALELKKVLRPYVSSVSPFQLSQFREDNGGFLKWRVPLVIIHFNGILHYKLSIWGYSHGHGTPHIINSIRPSGSEESSSGKWVVSRAATCYNFTTHY